MSELVLIGIVALLIFGPRKLPEIARTVGKTIADFKRTTDEFKETWEREASVTEIKNEMQDFSVELAKIKQISADQSLLEDEIKFAPENKTELPAIKELEPEQITNKTSEPIQISSIPENLSSEKQSWL